MKKQSVSLFVSLISVTLITTVGFAPVNTAYAQDMATSEFRFGPPLVYSATGILDARDRVKRVGWRETTIDAQLPSLFPSDQVPLLDKQAYSATLKAALFGESKRMIEALVKIKEMAEFWPETDLHSEHSQDGHRLAWAVRLLQGYDCLGALPEWKEIDREERQALRESIVSFSKRVLDDIPQILTQSEKIHFQSVRLYAGLISGVTEFVTDALKGTEQLPALKDLLRQGLTNEGLLVEGSPQQQIRAGHDWLFTATALKASAPGEFKALERNYRQSVEAICNLSGPAGQLPNVIGPLSPKPLGRFLEIGYALFGEPKCKAILDSLYKNDSPLAESLLLGQKPSVPKLPVSNLFQTAVMPQSGAAILRDVSSTVPLSIYLDTGLSEQSDYSPALLSIERLPQQKVLSTDRQGLSSTVTIDRLDRKKITENKTGQPRNAQIVSCKSYHDGASYFSAFASGQYASRPAYPKGTIAPALMTYERTLYLSSPLMIDLFRVRGGKTHDWIYHCLADIQEIIGGELSDYKVSENDYAFLSDSQVQAGPVKNIFSVLLTPTDGSGLSHRLWFIDPVGSQLIAGQKSDRTDLVVRREMSGDEGDLFAVVHEWFDGTEPPDVKLEKLDLNPRPNARDFQAIALAITRNDETAIFLSSTNPEVTYTADYNGKRIVFQGKFGHIRLKNGAFDWLRLIGGSQLRYDTHGMTLENPAFSGIVRRTGQTDGSIDIEFDKRLATGTELSGHSFTTVASQLLPVMIQPFIIDRIEGVDPPQRVFLQSFPNFIDPVPQLGSPVQVGDPILFDHSAELQRKNADTYTITVTAPVEVMVEGAPNRNRVFLNYASVLHRLRGESTAGVITFNIEPRETRNGNVEFSRVQ